jgi:hypothetical protein
MRLYRREMFRSDDVRTVCAAQHLAETRVGTPLLTYLGPPAPAVSGNSHPI